MASEGTVPPFLRRCAKNMEAVTIKSSRDRRCLVFSDHAGDYFTATITGDPVSATKKVWGYTDTQFLVEMFEGIARDWTGWEGERAFESIEGDFRVAATSDRLGPVVLTVSLRSNDLDDHWWAEAPIFLDAGSLDAVARQVDAFFTQEPTRHNETVGKPQ